MSESAATAQPVIKDVQTLKANLKEQEKRVRSENEVEEVTPKAAQQPTTVAQDGGEKRKRRKVSNPVGPTHDSEAPVLDGPLPSSTEQTEHSNNSSSANTNGALPADKNVSSAAPVSTSPTKATESAAKAPTPDATTASPVKEGQANSAVVEPSVKEIKEPATSKEEELKADGTTQKKAADGVARPEVAKDAAVPSEATESSGAEIINKPAETVKVAAS